MSTSSNLLNHTPNSPSTELRVLCLYRVSSNGQLYHNEKNEADIPMQRLECRRFADMMGWKIVYELQEEGISGHKVRAEQRDQIQKVKELAKQKKFDIFLVFMFDRIGRIADETPFVVEWLINAGIRVWSTQEGEQKIESHTDRLTNYIRYWQADGESQKTSIRTATRLAQITEDGHYSGRGCPFGYKLVKKGRVNKKGMPLNDLEIDEEEAGIVRLVFHKYVNEGYGPQRTANYLREIGSRNRKGKNWHPGTIRGMLHNLTYTGILRCGEARSPLIPELQIIDPSCSKGRRKSACSAPATMRKQGVSLSIQEGDLYWQAISSAVIAVPDYPLPLTERDARERTAPIPSGYAMYARRRPVPTGTVTDKPAIRYIWWMNPSIS